MAIFRQLTVLSQQKNIPYESHQENGPKQENCGGHLEIRVTERTLFPAHPLQRPGILDGHDKQGDGSRHQQEAPDIPRRLRPHDHFYGRVLLHVLQDIEYRESKAD